MSGRRRGRGRKAQNRARSHESGRRPQTGTSREAATSEPEVEVEGKTKRWSIVRLVVGLAKRPVAWGVALLIAIGSLWLNGTLNTAWNERIPSPQQPGLYLTNVATKMTVSSESKFRVVLCWSRNDPRGQVTEIIAEASTHLEGFEITRSARRCVSEPEAADKWRSSTREAAARAMQDWNAELAIMGAGQQSDQSMNVWFVRQDGDDTLGTGHQEPYKLINVRLQEDFHEEFRAQIAAAALTTAAPLVTTETRANILDKGLRNVGTKLTTLLEGNTIREPRDRAALNVALGDTMLTLGEPEAGTQQLERSANAYEEALTLYTREGTPRSWAKTQNNLAIVLTALGKRKIVPEKLERAVGGYIAALSIYTREQDPLRWAAVHINMGSALHTLGKWENLSERLEQAVDAYERSLTVITRDEKPEYWAAALSNLANTLRELAKREVGTERVKLAVDTYRRALTGRDREGRPLGWARTQDNLGDALMVLGIREGGTHHIKEAITAYEKALEVRTCSGVPAEWAATQQNLGGALAALGVRKNGQEEIERGIDAYELALEVFSPKRTPFEWGTTKNNLGRALQSLGIRQNSDELFEVAITAHKELLTPERRCSGTWELRLRNLEREEATSSCSGGQPKLTGKR